MDTHLSALTSEVLTRVEGTRLPGAKPQWVGRWEDRCLLRTSEGLREVAVDDVPADLDFAPLIDHTLLKPQAQESEIRKLCDEALQYQFASVCVNPCWVSLGAELLKGSPVRVCTVVGFPLGANTTRIKAEEAREAVALGAQEVDMVLAVGLAKAGNWEAVRRDYRAVREAAAGAVLKVILETCLLTDDEKAPACELAVEEGLDFVKTSTGFSTGGATEADIRLMRRVVGVKAGVKASGGIRSYEDARKMALAGASRLGLSSSIAVVQGGTTSMGGY
ncbi:MAG: deoxyribose-phosphate aldolase [Firmicutes bacterium]|nr:deoxyribose-phosphate aldolase [Bacillota bacterium]